MDYVWYAHESAHSVECVCMCARACCMSHYSMSLRKLELHVLYIHACIHAEDPPPPPPHPLSLSFSPSIYHASTGPSALGMRCVERGRERERAGEEGAKGTWGGREINFVPPHRCTLKMHIHFHTLKMH